MGGGAFLILCFQPRCTAHSRPNTARERTSGAKPLPSAENPPSVESIMVSAVARIMATTQGRTPERNASTPAYFIRFCSTDAMSRMTPNEGSTTPSVAHSAPHSPPWEAPTKVARFTASGPGVDSATAIKLKNVLSVSQPWFSTVSRTSEIIP